MVLTDMRRYSLQILSPRSLRGGPMASTFILIQFSLLILVLNRTDKALQKYDVDIMRWLKQEMRRFPEWLGPLNLDHTNG